MRLPSGAKTQEEASALLAKRYDNILKFVLAEIDELAKSGIADQRWCAIARTDVEKGFLALRNALPDKRDGRDYGKHPRTDDSASPREFTPPVDPDAGRMGDPKLTAGYGQPPRVEWHDHEPPSS